MLPEGLEERFRELRRRPALRRETRAAAEAAVVAWEYGTAKALWVPEVPLDPPKNQPPPRRLERPGEEDVQAGLDAEGRPVLVMDAGPRDPNPHVVVHDRLLFHHGSRVEVVGFLALAAVSHVTWVDCDDRGRPLRFAIRGVEYNDLGKGRAVHECEWEGDRCVRVRSRWSEDDRRFTEETRTGEYDEEGLLRVHREPHGPVPDYYERVPWDRRRDGWLEAPMPFDGALAAWVDWLESAVREHLPEPAGIARTGVDWTYGPPGLEWGTAQALDAVRRRAREPYDLLSALEHEIELTPPSIAWRSLRQSDIPSSDPRITAAAAELAARLDALPGLVLVAGVDEPVLAGLLGPPPADEPQPPTALPGSRDELRDLLREHELPERLADQAAWGAALERGGRGTSRLGGRPALPEGMAWPVSDGRRLTHLCTLDLAELPDFDGRDAVPRDGLLILLADITEEGELWDSVVVGEDDRVVLLHLPPGTALSEPPGRSSPSLRARRVRFVPVLTLPPERPAGLTAAELLAYERLYYALVELMPAHLMLGHPPPIQVDPRRPGEVSLLRLGWDEKLGFEMWDGGDITLHGATEDVAAGRWERLTITSESA